MIRAINLNEHTGEAGLHKGHLLQLGVHGEVYCVDCKKTLRWADAEEAWPTGEKWPKGGSQ